MATFYNQATLSYNGNTTTSNITTGELVEILSATKTAVTDTYQSEGRITYVVSIVNTDTEDFYRTYRHRQSRRIHIQRSDSHTS